MLRISERLGQKGGSQRPFGQLPGKVRWIDAIDCLLSLQMLREAPE
jgi:hypothetical protein